MTRRPKGGAQGKKGREVELLPSLSHKAGWTVRRLVRPCHELKHEWLTTTGPVRPVRLAGNR